MNQQDFNCKIDCIKEQLYNKYKENTEEETSIRNSIVETISSMIADGLLMYNDIEK